MILILILMKQLPKKNVVLAFPKWRLLFCALNSPVDMINFVKISTILVLFNKLKSEQNSHYLW